MKRKKTTIKFKVGIFLAELYQIFTLLRFFLSSSLKKFNLSFIFFKTLFTWIITLIIIIYKVIITISKRIFVDKSFLFNKSKALACG